MNKKEVIERLCALVTKVGDKHFDNEFAHDCFCGLSPVSSRNPDGVRVDDEIINFIECAVTLAIKTDFLGKQIFARYKNRTPDPGECKILSIDFENKTLSMTNGACRYYPSFDEVVIVDCQLS
jgi:hypothetical protein